MYFGQLSLDNDSTLKTQRPKGWWSSWTGITQLITEWTWFWVWSWSDKKVPKSSLKNWRASQLNRTFKSKFALQYALPWWGIVASLMPGLNARVKIIRELRAMFRESIEEHRSTRDANQPRDFLDVFLAEVDFGRPTWKRLATGGEGWKSDIWPRVSRADLSWLVQGRSRDNLNHPALVHINSLSGLHTTRQTIETMITYLTRCILYLTRYKEVQEAAREEVERETGEERPSLKHQLPYCQAVIQEVQRLSCVAPQTIPHRWNTIPTGHLTCSIHPKHKCLPIPWS